MVIHFLTKLESYVFEVEEVLDKREVKSNARRIKDLQDRLNRINELYIDGRIDKEKYDSDYIKNK